MILIPIFWRQYTTTMHGSALKFVPCENCSTEYVYVLERDGVGAGTSMYLLNNEGAADHAKSGAEETLKCVLANDFDPVPCPACGHYQRFMFPKLPETTGMWVHVFLVLFILIGCFNAAIAVYWLGAYLVRPNDDAFTNGVVAGSVLLPVCLIGLGLSLVQRSKIRNFDPNAGDPQARIALSRSRAVTRTEFEMGQQLRQV